MIRFWLSCIGWLLLHVSVNAQDTVDLQFSGKPIYIESIELEDERKKDRWSGRLGLGFSYAPDYPGAENNSGSSALDFKASWNDRIFIENNKFGAVVLSKRLYRIGVISRYSFDRREVFVGAGGSSFPKLDEAFEVGLFAGTSLYKLFLTGELYMDVSNVHGGTAIELETGYTFEMNSRLTFTPILGLRWGSKDYINTYFGAPDELREQFEEFSPKGGLFEYFAEAAMEYRLGKKWLFKSSLRYAQLAGSAGGSPLVESLAGAKGQASLFSALIWLF